MHLLENFLLSFNKFQEIKYKSKEQKKYLELQKYESLIEEEIKIFNKTFEEIRLENLISENGTEQKIKITEEDYKKILENIDTIKYKLNFLLNYKKRQNENYKLENKYLNEKYNEILNVDFSITNSIERIAGNIPCKKILDFDVVNKNNCTITSNLVKFENFGVYDSEFTKSIDITNHNISLEKLINSENILYVSFTNTKISNDFIINVKQNGKNINVFNGKVKHNAIINIAIENVESINIYSEADISYILDTIEIKSYSKTCEDRKGFYSLLTKNVNDITNLYFKSDFDYEIFIFDENQELNYNINYQDMKIFCEKNLEKIQNNELIEKSISKNFGIIVLFNTKNYCSTLIDIFYN